MSENFLCSVKYSLGIFDFQNEGVGKVLLVLGMGKSEAIMAIFLWL